MLDLKQFVNCKKRTQNSAGNSNYLTKKLKKINFNPNLMLDLKQFVHWKKQTKNSAQNSNYLTKKPPKNGF